jgi:hypothetical protein
MTTEFDDDAGVLRVSDAALSVLARLAVAPTDPSLTDHATAPPLAELRAAGILGPGGIDPAVRPLAEVMGAPVVRLQLVLEEGGVTHRGLGWAVPDLLVLGVRSPRSEASYDLMAEAPAQAAGLISDLLGLVAAPPSPPADPVVVDADGLAELLAPGATARWRLVVSAGEATPAAVLEVLDAGEAGLFELTPAGEVGAGLVELRTTDPMAVRARISALLADALTAGQAPGPA